MKYILLIHQDESLTPAPDSPEFGPFMQGYFALNEVLEKDGTFIAGEGLQGPDSATTVKVRDGKTITTDGPFAETREVMGGFYLIDCDNLDQAIAYAAKIPSAKFGTIEIKPVMDYGQ